MALVDDYRGKEQPWPRSYSDALFDSVYGIRLSRVYLNERHYVDAEHGTRLISGEPLMPYVELVFCKFTTDTCVSESEAVTPQVSPLRRNLLVDLGRICIAYNGQLFGKKTIVDTFVTDQCGNSDYLRRPPDSPEELLRDLLFTLESSVSSRSAGRFDFFSGRL